MQIQATEHLTSQPQGIEASVSVPFRGSSHAVMRSGTELRIHAGILVFTTSAFHCGRMTPTAMAISKNAAVQRETLAMAPQLDPPGALQSPEGHPSLQQQARE